MKERVELAEKIRGAGGVKVCFGTEERLLSAHQQAWIADALVAYEARPAPVAEGLASADTKRLDFIEEKGATIYCSESGHWVFVNERAKTRKGVLGIGVRGCIDAALSSGPQQP